MTCFILLFNSINSKEFIELKKRKKQIKTYFQLFEDMNVVVESISTTLIAYYIDIEGHKTHYDLIQENELMGQLQTGHLQLIKI